MATGARFLSYGRMGGETAEQEFGEEGGREPKKRMCLCGVFFFNWDSWKRHEKKGTNKLGGGEIQVAPKMGPSRICEAGMSKAFRHFLFPFPNWSCLIHRKGWIFQGRGDLMLGGEGRMRESTSWGKRGVRLQFLLSPSPVGINSPLPQSKQGDKRTVESKSHCAG